MAALAFVSGRLTSTTPPSETPSPPTATLEPKPTEPPPTPTLPPTNTPAPTFTPQPATPTRRPDTPTPTEIVGQKLWGEIPITETYIGARDEKRTVVAPDFLLNGANLFITDAQGVLTQIDAKTGKIMWQWENKGIPIAAINGLLYALHKETPRVYVLDEKTKQEIGKFNLPDSLLRYASPTNFAPTIKWPVLGFGKVAYLETINGNLGLYSGVNRTLDFEDRHMLLVTPKVQVYTKPTKGSYIGYELDVDYEIAPTSLNQEGNITFSHVLGERHVVMTLSAAPQSETWIKGVRFEDGKVWEKRFTTPDWKPIHASDKFVVLEKTSPYTPTVYKLLNIEDGQEAASFEAENMSKSNVFSYGNWVFFSNPRTGTTAFKDGTRAWINDEVLGAIKCLGEVSQNLIFSRGGFGSTIFGNDPVVNGVIWALDNKNGKSAWKPAQFDQFSANSVRVGDKLVVADGISSARWNLNTVDLKTGQKSVIYNPSNKVTQLASIPGENIVIGEVVGGKLFAVKL